MVVAWVGLGALGGCPESTDEPSADTEQTQSTSSSGSQTEAEPKPEPERLLVTADFLHKTLSLLDYDAVVHAAATRDEALYAEVDLSAYEPGPLQVEIAPDGHTAVVSISPAFFDGIVGSSIGVSEVTLDGTLLVVDLQQREVVAELATAHVPMGIAIDPEGRRAYTANFGHSDAPGTTMSVIDLQSLTVLEDIEVGAGPEQVSLSSDGTLGILNLAGDGAVVVFSTSDPAGTLSEPLEVAADPSDVDFIDGTHLAVVANSLGPSAYTILDVSDPAAPSIVHEGEPPGGIPYGVTKIPGTTDFVMTVAHDAIRFVRADATAPEAFTWMHTVQDVAAFPLGVAIDAPDGVAIAAAPGEDALVVLQLDGTMARTLPWLPNPGPTYVALAPRP